MTTGASPLSIKSKRDALAVDLELDPEVVRGSISFAKDCTNFVTQIKFKTMPDSFLMRSI